MQSKPKIHNFKFRLALTTALIAGGFVFPIIFLLALMVGWSLIQDIRNPQQEVDGWFTRRWTATADDPDWKEYFLPFCESPAESAFLTAMISARGLVPDKGILRGTDLMLDMQVEIPPYRADFLVNRWLVVEIDGATYHSSPEAVERDKVRDEFMQKRGYSVLRIPASVVFTTPDKAVDQVISMLRRELSTSKGTIPPRTDSNKKRISFQDMLSKVNSTTAEINTFITTQKSVEDYTKDYKDKFYAERLVIEKSIEMAESDIRVNQFISQSEEHRKNYFAAYNELRNKLSPNTQHNHGMDALRPAAFLAIAAQPNVATHPNPNINEAIARARQAILSERESFFSSVRLKLNNDETLKRLVRENLNELGCNECWQNLS